MKKIFILSFILSFLLISHSNAQWWVKGGNILWPYGNVNISSDLYVSGSIINDNIHPYRVYVALITQNGSDAPEAIVLENTLGSDVIWSRTSAGIYTATLTGAFNLRSTIPILYYYHPGTIDEWFISQIVYVDYNTITITTQIADFTVPDLYYADGLLNYTPVEIRVYR